MRIRRANQLEVGDGRQRLRLLVHHRVVVGVVAASHAEVRVVRGDMLEALLAVEGLHL